MLYSVQSLSHVWLFATPWITARQASLSITNSRSSLRLTSIESVMPYSHLIPCRPLRLLPPIPPSIRVFSNESTLRMRWPKYWSFSFSIIPSLTFHIFDYLDILLYEGPETFIHLSLDYFSFLFVGVLYVIQVWVICQIHVLRIPYPTLWMSFRVLNSVLWWKTVINFKPIYTLFSLKFIALCFN